jgi:acyl-CoA thioesterase
MPWLKKDATIEEVREAFKADRFATKLCGIRVEEAGYHHAVCSMDLTDQPLNAQGNPRGGAIFTLADFCLAIISNIGEEPTASVSSTIEYISVAKGKTLRAEGRVVKSGRSMGFYAIDVWDDLDNHVAHMIATGHRRPPV